MKWPWSRQEPPEPRIRNLEALEGWVLRLEALERQVKGIVLDWDETYDKFRRLYARLAKRVSDANKELASDVEAQEGPVDQLPPDTRPRDWQRDKTFLRKLAHQQRNSA